ncbi:MAG: hypothetical protein HY976_01070 [Candidatus Kerfeldbacteria bacterium]|nr:hypothetical protein [Candidatus Kerfeldbacteria bacterium]
MSAEPQGSKDDVLEVLNDPRLLRRAIVTAIVTAVVATVLFLLWLFR